MMTTAWSISRATETGCTENSRQKPDRISII
jgi:hypothetical protein